ncbi:MAG: biotin transporter BioY [Gemmatimonadetes bacterium]|nr:biotin transporter BioY [Gemmatimonadota bacterium]
MSELLLTARRLAALEVVSTAPLRRALLLALFALLTALGAYVAVPLPVGPVPLSLQTLFVILSGLLLGARLGAASQALYLAAGFAGLPVFAQGLAGPGVLLGPTGGYLLAFPAAAALAGWLAARTRGPASVLVLTAAAALGSATILAGGWAQLAILVGSAPRAAAIGIVPFLIGDVLKVGLGVLLAAALEPRFRQLR